MEKEDDRPTTLESELSTNCRQLKLKPSENNNLKITKYCNITKYDRAPFGALCKVSKNIVTSKRGVDGEAYELYLQISKDEDNPKWIAVGDLLTKVFEKSLDNERFVNHVIEQYLHKLRQDILDDALLNMTKIR